MITNRFFSNLELAKSQLKAIAVQYKTTMYLYKITYGSNQTAEYSVRFPDEIQDLQSEHIIDSFTPKQIHEDETHRTQPIR